MLITSPDDIPNGMGRSSEWFTTRLLISNLTFFCIGKGFGGACSTNCSHGHLKTNTTRQRKYHLVNTPTRKVLAELRGGTGYDGSD
ncbi:hypothetical protein OH492_16240 [Vibrio chagasii]|nr:hypothetical protein [Vibrio chagasii]